MGKFGWWPSSNAKKLLTEKKARKLTVDVGLLINTDEPDWFEKRDEIATVMTAMRSVCISSLCVPLASREGFGGL